MEKVVRMVQTMIESMPNTRRGFSFLQLMIVIAIIGVISMVVAPNFFKRVPLYAQKEWVTTLNAVARQAWVQALETGRPQKVTFNLAQRTIGLYRQTRDFDRDGKPVFAPVALDQLPQNYQWPEQFEIKQFYIEGVDEISAHSSEKTMEDVWFFIVPDGMAQEVVMNVVDVNDTHHSIDGQELSLVLNPFRVQFEMYDEFQNPAAL